MELSGTCDPRFQAVADAFETNLRERGEGAASVCVTLEGERVVDLRCGGWRDDTLTTVFSCTKAATALCAHVLIARDALRLEDRVTDHWPDYAAHGKSETTIADLLAHRSGLPALRAPVPEGGSYDFSYMAERLAAEQPWWKPGTDTGYQMTTFGWLVGEIVRRVSGKSLGAFFRDEIAEPPGRQNSLDFWIGLPEAQEHRVAPVKMHRPQPGDPQSDFIKVLGDPNSIQHLATFNSGRANPNHRAHRAAELGGHGGVADARALAGLLTPVANGALLPRAHIATLGETASAPKRDRTLLIPTRFSHGFMLPMGVTGAGSLVAPEGSFGHVGLGGSLTWAVPERRLAFGYATTKHGAGILLNPRGQSLLDAALSANTP